MARGVLIGMTVLGLAACTHEPMDYIPQGERTLLKAQARMGEGGVSGQPVSVDEMLQRARGQSQAASADRQRLVVQFSGDAVMLDDAQRKSLTAFSAAVGNAPVVVTGQRGGFAGGSPLLGQRRAVAVANALSVTLTSVDVRFVPNIPDNIVVVSTGSAGPESTQP
jgi:hypothetical protein